jgi:hypothetical protein
MRGALSHASVGGNHWRFAHSGSAGDAFRAPAQPGVMCKPGELAQPLTGDVLGATHCGGAPMHDVKTECDRRGRRLAIRGAALLCVSLGLALWLVGGAATAHDFYPVECCHSTDCAPVDHVEVVAGATYYAGVSATTRVPPSVTIVTTRHGAVAVPENFPRRESPDGRMHACISAGADGGNRLLCFWVPPSS